MSVYDKSIRDTILGFFADDPEYPFDSVPPQLLDNLVKFVEDYADADTFNRDLSI